MKSECVDFRELAGQNPLFLSFLYEFDKVAPFYLPLPYSTAALKKRADEILQTPRFPRRNLMPSLQRFNSQIGAGERAGQNIEKLASSDAVAVVAGQQVGMFGGPAYAVYKAATAVQLARMLQEQGYAAVPVFWLAADDSDFQEVRSTSFYDEEGRVFSVSCRDDPDREGQMSGTVPLDRIGGCLDKLDARWEKGQLAQAASTRLRQSYRPDSNFREAFGSWLSHLFRDYGLVLFDPLMPDHRKHLGSFYATAVEKREEIVADLLGRARALEDNGFQPQVWYDESETLLFLIERNRRYKIRFEEGRFRAKGKESFSASRDELLQLVEAEPGNFGTNVLLRPILQDYLFPTALYVGGPTEIAYFSQVNAITSHWQLTLNIVPRAGFTIVDRKAQRLLAKHGLRAEELLNGSRSEVVERVLRDGQTQSILAGFDRLRDNLSAEFEAFGQQLGHLDPSVAEMLGNTQSKILYHIDKVNRRFVANYESRVPHLRNHLDYLLARFAPQGQLQERVINFNQFLMEEGRDFLDRLVEETRPFCLSHRLLYM